MGLMAVSANHRIECLDGWRGVSIFFVLQGHFFSTPQINLGTFGVLMFFGLSGRLMANLLFEQRQPLGLFYRRRFSRVYPTFALFVLAMFAVAAFQGRSFSSIELASTLMFLRTYFPTPGIWNTPVPIGHIWSLNVEEHAYVFMSVLVLLRLRREGWMLFGSGVMCIIVGFAYVKLGGPFWGNLGTEVAASFILVSGGYSLVCWKLRRFLPAWLPVACLALAMFIDQAGSVWWLGPAISPFLIAIAINHLSDATTWVRSALSWAPLRKMGVYSFSLYLWQQPFFAAGKDGLAWPIALVGAILTGLVSFYLVENPSRLWLNKRWQHAASSTSSRA